MTSSNRLGRDVFLSLAAIGWADGKLDRDEADAIVRTALEEGLELEEITEIEEATKKPIDLSFIDRSTMSKADRLFVYAVATWLTRIDGKVDDKEKAALDKLGALLKVPEKPRAYADEIAKEVAMLGDGDRPARFDLKALRETLGQRLAEAQRLRGAD
jgi:uncharacterized membrane protein YebE (DUF533 family)